MKFLNPEKLSLLSASSFKKGWPYPWQEWEELLTPEGFSQLCRDFPSLKLFQYHEGLARGYGQRPHDRYYLAYEKSFYQNKEQGPGIVSENDLEDSWKAFINELQENPVYKTFMQEVLELEKWSFRFAWHMGQRGNEVSPHLDNVDKIATHIFYFNTDENWDASWGGEITVFGEKLTPRENPDFDDFAIAIPISIMNNRSFLFKNTPNSWHGVRPLHCPENKYRKLFNVIYGKS